MLHPTHELEPPAYPARFNLNIGQQAIEAAYAELTDGLTDEDKDKLGRAAVKMPILVKAPERIVAICGDIAKHYQEKVAPNGFGAQLVTFDRESCLFYRHELDKHLPPETSDIVMSANCGEDEYAAYRRGWDAEEKLLDRFRDPKDESDWPRQHEWLAAKVNDFHRVFLARLRDLDAEDWQQDREVGSPTSASQSPE